MTSVVMEPHTACPEGAVVRIGDPDFGDMPRRRIKQRKTKRLPGSKSPIGPVRVGTTATLRVTVQVVKT